MNRCLSYLLHLPGLVFALALSATLPANAQTDTEAKPVVRQFPPAARRGELVVVAPPVITMDGKEERLSVGSRIRDANNLLVMSGALAKQKLVVNYTRESAGHVHNVWILNSEEIKEKRPGMSTSWFGFGSNTPETPSTAAKP